MSIWNPQNLTLHSMRKLFQDELNLKYRNEVRWDPFDLGDAVLLAEGYRGYLSDYSLGLVV